MTDRSKDLILELPIVGLFHHPPAMALGKLLPLGANLWVRPEPTNTFDANAIAVDLDIDLLNLAHKVALRTDIKEAFDHYRAAHPDTGLWLEDIEQTGKFHLGYLAATDALQIKANLPQFVQSPGVLRFGPKGKPLVRFAARSQ